MIRIVYTLPNFNTAGSGKALLNLALGLDKAKFEAQIVCESDKGSFFQVVKDSGIPVHVFKYIPPRSPIGSWIKASSRARQEWKKLAPDIVHSFHYSDNYTEGLAVRLSGVKWLFTKKNMSWGGKSGNGWLFRSLLANGIAVQNTDMITNFYPKSNKVQLIPRGVNIERYKSQIPIPTIRKEMETPMEARIVICVANMVPVKGVELLIEAFDEIKANFSKWHVWLIGDINNDYGKFLTEQVRKKGLNSRVHFAGKRSNVREYLDHAEVFVLPTKDEGRREGSPVALLEAMANAKVVLGSSVPGVKDQLANFPEHQFHPGDSKSLKGKLESFMLNDLKTNSRLGEKLSTHVQANYSIQLEIKKHEQFYHNLIKSGESD